MGIGPLVNDDDDDSLYMLDSRSAGHSIKVPNPNVQLSYWQCSIILLQLSTKVLLMLEAPAQITFFKSQGLSSSVCPFNSLLLQWFVPSTVCPFNSVSFQQFFTSMVCPFNGFCTFQGLSLQQLVTSIVCPFNSFASTCSLCYLAVIFHSFGSVVMRRLFLKWSFI